MRTRKFAGLIGLLAATSYVATAACGGSDFSGGDDDGTGGGGSDGGPGTVIDPNCDQTKTPSQDSCVINEAVGFFVSGTANKGDDSGDGTRAHPFATIQKGIATAQPGKKRVYLCLGNYPEQLALADGVSIYGDLDCTQNWKYVPTQHALLDPPSSPVAKADKVTDATRIEGLDITAPDGTPTSRSSIALVVTGSPALTVANATILSGKGFDGVDGVEGVQLTQSTAGNGGSQSTGGAVALNFVASSIPQCPGYSPNPSPNCPANGAGGGTTTCVAPSGSTLNVTMLQPGGGGAGGAGAQCTLADTCNGPSLGNGNFALAACCTGSPASGGAGTGASPIPGKNGANGVAAWNGLDLAVGDGTAGTNGQPGPGGGGGTGMNPYFPDTGAHKNAGTTGQGAGGSGGGAGGCPGLAGTFGTGGGASIAVVTDSAFTLDTCIVKSGNGGRAGHGTFGSNPTAGGAGGTSPLTVAPYLPAPTSLGGMGGSGTMSGWSGNGSAGPSYAIASHGATPLLLTTTPQAGNGGAGVDVRTQGAKTIPATPAGGSNVAFTF